MRITDGQRAIEKQSEPRDMRERCFIQCQAPACLVVCNTGLLTVVNKTLHFGLKMESATLQEKDPESLFL